MTVVEQRRHERAAIDLPVQFAAKGSTELASGRAADISLGGMFLKTESPAPFGAEIVVHMTPPGHREPLSFRAVVRWRRGGGMGLQFALLGARETHAITEWTRQSP